MDRKGIIFQGATVVTQGLQSSAIALPANNATATNPGRTAFMIQNQDASNPLKVRFGAGASTSVYDVVLKACTATADGTGGTVAMESGTVYTGIITVFSAGTASYTVFEM